MVQAAHQLALGACPIVDRQLDQHAIRVLACFLVAATHDVKDFVELALERGTHRVHLVLERALGQDRQQLADELRERHPRADRRQSKLGNHEASSHTKPVQRPYPCVTRSETSGRDPSAGAMPI